jgi:predicted CDP-diglyceride synthetase/phosphatidate cytidylyltransferase
LSERRQHFWPWLQNHWEAANEYGKLRPSDPGFWHFRRADICLCDRLCAAAALCPPTGPNAAVENLNARIKAWWVMVILIGIAFIAGRVGVLVLFAFCSFAALREFVTLINTRRADHWALASAFFVVLPIQYYLLWAEEYGIFAIFIPVYAFLLMPIISVLRGDTERFPRFALPKCNGR